MHDEPGSTIPRVVALTGAGISAASGVPTFRDALDGLWARYDPQELATPQAFQRQPLLVWQFYDYRRQIIAACQPNAAHRVLAEMERDLPHFTLVTQNIDGLHQAAGSKNILCLHGDIWELRCTRCRYRARNRQTPLAPLPPTCPQCGALLRPDVVWFGEMLAPGVLQRAQRSFAEADIALVIGTSAVVYPAAALPDSTLRHGGQVIEFNIETTPLSARASRTILGEATQTLPAWWDAFRRRYLPPAR